MLLRDFAKAFSKLLELGVKAFQVPPAAAAAIAPAAAPAKKEEPKKEEAKPGAWRAVLVLNRNCACSRQEG